MHKLADKYSVDNESSKLAKQVKQQKEPKDEKKATKPISRDKPHGSGPIAKVENNQIQLEQYEKYRRKIGSVVETTKGGDKEKIKEALNVYKHEQELQRISSDRSK